MQVLSYFCQYYRAASPARSVHMRSIAADVARSVVWWSVCQYVGHTGELCQNGRAGADSCGSNVLDGSPFATGSGTFRGHG